jgi:predicted transcriptional regulator
MKLSNTRDAKLEALRRKASSEIEWRGKGGFTDRDVYLSLVEEAQEHGRPHPEGIVLSISMRELSRIARVGRKAVSRSLNERLIPAGLVKRATTGWGARSGSLILPVYDDVLDLHEQSSTADATESNPIPKLRWGAHKLGKLSGAILETIQAHSPCTRPEVAKVLGRKSRDIKPALNRLVDSGLVVRDGDKYSLPANFEDLLQERLLTDGTIETDRKHEELYESERKAYLRDVIGEEEVRPRPEPKTSPAGVKE